MRWGVGVLGWNSGRRIIGRVRGLLISRIGIRENGRRRRLVSKLGVGDYLERGCWRSKI